MAYITCKCGVKLNTEEITQCPVCDDIVRHEKTMKYLADIHAKNRIWQKIYREKNREYFRKKQLEYIARKNARIKGIAFHKDVKLSLKHVTGSSKKSGIIK